MLITIKKWVYHQQRAAKRMEPVRKRCFHDWHTRKIEKKNY